MNFKEPGIFSLVIYRYRDFVRKNLIFPFLVLENFQLKRVFILITAVSLFHTTHYLLTYCVTFLFIVFIFLYPS